MSSLIPLNDFILNLSTLLTPKPSQILLFDALSADKCIPYGLHQPKAGLTINRPSTGYRVEEPRVYHYDPYKYHDKIPAEHGLASFQLAFIYLSPSCITDDLRFAETLNAISPTYIAVCDCCLQDTRRHFDHALEKGTVSGGIIIPDPRHIFCKLYRHMVASY